MKGKNLIGGIVTPKTEGSTVWKINNSKIYSDNLNDLSQWKNFDSVLNTR